MKNFKATYIFTFAAAALLSVATSACKDDIINTVDPNIPDSEIQDGETMYMAVRIYDAASIGTDTRGGTRDDETGSDNEDDNDNGKFDVGLAEENAIYTAATTAAESPNFMLVFSNDDQQTLEYKFPLIFGTENTDWENSNTSEDVKNKNTTALDKSYKTFFVSAQKYKLPASFEDRKVLVVLNASDALSETLDNYLDANESYENVLALQRDSEDTYDPNFLFLETDDGTKYFTMSSSMVYTKKNEYIDGSNLQSEEYRPAVIKRSFTWQPTKEKAAATPILSLFVERLHTKVTLSYQTKGDDIRYFFPSGSVTKEYTLNNKKYSPVNNNNFVLTSIDDFDPAQDFKKIRYIKKYTRREHNHTPGENQEGDTPQQLDGFIQTTENWKINLTGWGINGTAKKEYVFKKLGPSFSYDGLDNYWNPEANSPYRNFWAEGAYYDNLTYPAQYRPIYALKKTTTGEGNNAVTTTTIEKDNSEEVYANSEEDYLKYSNYSALSNKVAHNYAPEHTFNTSVFGGDLNAAFDGKDYLRAGTHVILTAQLLIEGFDPEGVYSATNFSTTTGSLGLAVSGSDTEEETEEKTAKDKYYMNGIFWERKAYMEYVIDYLGEWMLEDKTRFPNSDGYFYVENSENNGETPFKLASNKDFDIVSLNVKGGDGMVWLQPKTGVDIYYKKTSVSVNEDPYIKITDSNFENSNFNFLSLSHPEYFAKRYNQGRMYYAIPIEHYRNGTGNIYLGKYGAVRNHWYSFNISSFSAPGTPVDDPTQEIIPNNERSDETLGITLSIFPWHTINTDVDIDGQRPNVDPSKIDMDLYMKVDDWDYEGEEHKFGS